MTTETDDAGQEPSAEDTAAVLAHAATGGEKTFLTPKDEGEGGDAPATPGDDAAAAQTEGQAAQPKPKQTAQERIDELTRARREAERDRDFYKEQALRGGKPAETPAQEAQPAQPTDGKPNPEAFDGGIYDPAYLEALTDWKVDQRLAQNDGRQAVTTKLSAWEAKSKELFPDGSEGLTAFKAHPTLPQAIFDVLLESDLGPKLADHLGANPAEFQRISGLSPALQARELGKLEATFATPAKPPAKTLTDAPEPAPQARGSGGQFKVAADTDDFTAFEKQYRIGG